MEELVEKAKNGDKEAFATIILSLEDDLYRIVELRLSNKDDIFDAIQETIIIALQSIKKLSEIQYFKTWNFADRTYFRWFLSNIDKSTNIANPNLCIF